MSTILGKGAKGLAFILSAPAGTGKTTLAKRLIEEFPGQVIASISYTTRAPREGEISGKDYHFVTQEEFANRISTNDFLEYVHLYGASYGTSKEWVNAQLEAGKHVLLVIDTQGAMQLKEKFPVILVFVRPPSLEELQARLLNRGTEGPEMRALRLEWAKIELEKAKQYDYQIVNDDLEIAYGVLRSILIAECHRSSHLSDIR